MATLRAHGIEAPLPAGFEGRIFTRASTDGSDDHPVAQFATFSLPDQAGDFGGGVVNLLGTSDVFAVLFEYGPESVGKRLFTRQGMPRTLGPGDFRPYALRRGIPGQSGTQWFFTEGGRPFTLYVVLGSHVGRAALVPRVNELLVRVAIAPAGPPPATVAAFGTSSGGPSWN